MPIFPISLTIMALVWVFSFIMWLMPEQMRWDYDLFHYYRLTFLELPAFAVLIGTALVYLRRFCPTPRLFKIVMWATWGYVFFPIILSGLLILITTLGITGY